MLVWAFHQGGWSQSCFKRSGPLEDQTVFFYLRNKGVLKEKNMIITYLLLHWMFPRLAPWQPLLLMDNAPTIYSKFTFSQIIYPKNKKKRKIFEYDMLINCKDGCQN